MPVLGNYQFLQTTIPSPLRDCQLHQNPSPTVFYFPISSILQKCTGYNINYTSISTTIFLNLKKLLLINRYYSHKIRECNKKRIICKQEKHRKIANIKLEITSREKQKESQWWWIS